MNMEEPAVETKRVRKVSEESFSKSRQGSGISYVSKINNQPINVDLHTVNLLTDIDRKVKEPRVDIKDLRGSDSVHRSRAKELATYRNPKKKSSHTITHHLKKQL
jgi:hypothetical protein